jgi:hypothetical protein
MLDSLCRRTTFFLLLMTNIHIKLVYYLKKKHNGIFENSNTNEKEHLTYNEL